MRFDDFIARFLLTKQSNSKRIFANHLKHSAVLVPIINVGGEAHILLCKRPTYLKHHPGQICFPGGKVEPEDDSYLATALRECEEELAIPAQSVTILGQLSPRSTPTGFVIAPIIATLPWPLEFTPNSNEVAATFTLPVATLRDASQWQSMHVPTRQRLIEVNGMMTEQGLLWGATARIIHRLLKSIA
ncbi:CoA pyrophosphatase [Pseudoalteromonas fenneropenaei]|uniref:CoA pyrophosphatase n=1 Tax=Pseudoalteromonas fenneropenaei TaxID=1737459 RepID=A0ABV7CI57_9GAMM